MPRLKLWGGAIDVGDLGPRQVRATPTARQATPPIDVRKFCRNGLSASAQYQNLLNEATNASVLHRSRLLFTAVAPTGSSGTSTTIPASSASSSRARFRFAFKTSDYSHAVIATVLLAPPSATYADSPSAGRLTIYSDVAEAVSVGSVDFFYGASPKGSGSSAHGWSYAKTVTMSIEGLAANTDFYARFDDIDHGRIHAACVWEMQTMTAGLGGFLSQSLNSDSEVLDVHRENVSTIQRALWKHSGGLILPWTRNDGTSPATFAAATPTNVIDGSSTTYGSSVPGFNFVMTNKDRLSQPTGIPFVLKAFCSTASPTGAGRIYIKDSSGSTIASITNGWTVGGTPKWQSATGVLPATDARYFLAADNNSSSTLSVYAATAYELE